MATTLSQIFRENEQGIYDLAVSQARQVGPHYATAPDTALRRTFELILNSLIDYWETGDETRIDEWADWRAHLSFSLDFSPSEVLQGLDILPEQLRPYIVQSLSDENEMLTAMSKMDEGIGLLRRHYTDRHFALQEQRLVKLHEGIISISLESNLENALKLAVNTARDLVGARFAALGVAGDNGQFAHLVTAGTNGEKAKSSRDLPKQILTAILREEHSFRAKDLNLHPRFSDYPATKCFLGAPITVAGQVKGSLYLTEKVDGDEFTENDQRLIEMLAAHAAIAIERKQVEDALRLANIYNRSLIEAGPDPLVTIGPDGKITDVNEATGRVTGLSREQLIGTDFSNYFTEPDKARQGYQQVFARGFVTDYPLTIHHKDGRLTDVLYNANVYKDTGGNVIGVCAVARDVTEQKRAEVTITQQAQEILELSTPVVQVWDGVVLVPLIGSLDSQRTQQVTERLLTHIVETNSPVALLDVTGVPTIDTQTARHLLETIAAVRLLGAQVILSGLRPAIAQAMVHLGIDLGQVTTCSSLSASLRLALEMIDLRIAHRNGV